MDSKDNETTDLVVIGAGPGGYAAAFHAADQGQQVILVERDERLGGTCLNRGCIPSKAYLHATGLIDEARRSGKRGIVFAEPRIELRTLRSWKESVLDQLAAGIRSLAKARGVTVVHGRGHFQNSNTLRVETEDGQTFIRYRHAIIATGSVPSLPRTFDLGNPRVITSDEALELNLVREKLLIVGAGYIGMELGMVYHALGSKITMLEATGSALAGADPDLVKPVMQVAQAKFHELRLNTRVLEMASSGPQIQVLTETANAKGSQDRQSESFDAVLVAVGRRPNCDDLGLANTKVTTGAGGFIQVDSQQRTEDPSILAIGDVTGGLMLAHKATKQARIAAAAITGDTLAGNDELLIPAVVFTHPEIAWVGLTEIEARAQGLTHKVVRYPWAGLGRAQTMSTPEGFSKLIIEPESERILGVGIVGHGAGELIAEGALAIEMGATAYDLAETTHPHPTLSESLMECANLFYGTSPHATPPVPATEESTN